MLADRVFHENDPGPRCDRLQGSLIEVDMNIRAMKKKGPWLFVWYTWDEMLLSYVRDYFINLS